MKVEHLQRAQAAKNFRVILTQSAWADLEDIWCLLDRLRSKRSAN